MQRQEAVTHQAITQEVTTQQAITPQTITPRTISSQAITQRPAIQQPVMIELESNSSVGPSSMLLNSLNWLLSFTTGYQLNANTYFWGRISGCGLVEKNKYKIAKDDNAVIDNAMESNAASLNATKDDAKILITSEDDAINDDGGDDDVTENIHVDFYLNVMDPNSSSLCIAKYLAGDITISQIDKTKQSGVLNGLVDVGGYINQPIENLEIHYKKTKNYSTGIKTFSSEFNLSAYGINTLFHLRIEKPMREKRIQEKTKIEEEKENENQDKDILISQSFGTTTSLSI
jgi:hypothetical protein